MILPHRNPAEPAVWGVVSRGMRESLGRNLVRPEQERTTGGVGRRLLGRREFAGPGVRPPGLRKSGGEAVFFYLLIKR